jgi:hypothetical protein
MAVPPQRTPDLKRVPTAAMGTVATSEVIPPLYPSCGSRAGCDLPTWSPSQSDFATVNTFARHSPLVPGRQEELGQADFLDSWQTELSP